MPKEIWDKKRMIELKDAIDRYITANLAVPIEWIKEYNELVKIYSN